MGNHDAGAALQNQLKRRLNLCFREWVNARSGFIQNEHGRVLHQYARQRHQLALAKREARAAFAHFTVQAVGQRVKPLAGADLVRNGQYLCTNRQTVRFTMPRGNLLRLHT